MQEMKSLNGFKLVDEEGRQLIKETEGRINTKITKISKHITNLENGYTDEPFRTDTTNAYEKAVPENALPYAEVESVGETVTAIKSLGGNKVLSDEAVITSKINSLTVTDLGGGKFQLDGYTGFGEGDFNYETGKPNVYTFLSVTVKAGLYQVSKKLVSEGNSEAFATDMALVVNGNRCNFGIINVSEDTDISIQIGVASFGNGLVSAIYTFEIFEVDNSKNAVANYSEFISKPCHQLTITDLGGGVFHLNGYTAEQDYVYCTFLKIPLKAGTYSTSPSAISDIILEDGVRLKLKLKVNGTEINFGNSITVTEDTTAEIMICIAVNPGCSADTIVIPSIGTEDIRAVIDTLNVPLGEDNFIAVEPMGSLVFENEGNKAVPSTVTYMLKGE